MALLSLLGETVLRHQFPSGPTNSRSTILPAASAASCGLKGPSRIKPEEFARAVAPAGFEQASKALPHSTPSPGPIAGELTPGPSMTHASWQAGASLRPGKYLNIPTRTQPAGKRWGHPALIARSATPLEISAGRLMGDKL
jgi:hypothetical protein